ncbi:DUF2391 domain-containing protein [Natronosalvus vescus]|uniref:DUF2391 domain-containing protein n=1 Tax=Natronosalvus vescus TaxID=2953881 RepID=UPI002091945C|nr:DUF2391 domain-containing protein [Natronosalvus vescus]
MTRRDSERQDGLEATEKRIAETDGGGEGVAVETIVEQLRKLQDTVDEQHHGEIEETKRMLTQLPGSRTLEQRITKYTSRDVGEAAVGSIIFALPLLVEDGVFEIADHLVDVLVAGIPVFLLANIAFVIALTAGLLYAVDIREVKVTNPIFGVVPRRLTGVLAVSLVVTTILMVGWGRLFVDDPSMLAMVGRITVIWAAAALGASLGDILPGESKGTDLTVGNLDAFGGSES